ncbi:unnamed protein product [Prorocentrum cordatum]|uniref:Methyltransferase domain-containing protein n=1 Tax=Prorocentrum cordatum TaxID=2364126 RepID=A0ABN9RSL7_9DINO|nr:unnamed protein product [Polarella glacialis]
MVNDTDRNDFYYPGLAGRALESCDLRGKFVLDIGSGSGILSMMAARLGARRVVAVDENADLVRLARHNVSANGLADVVEVRHGLSTELELDEKADVLVTETMGTWMTCEGMVQWCEDARKRLLKEGAQVVPQRGVQYAVLVESEELAGLTSCWKPYRGIDLSAVMELQDTSSCLWTKRVGVKPSSLVYQELCEPFPLLEVDFGSTPFSAMPRTAENRPRMRAGRVHAVLDFWICEDAQGRQLSTDPRARRCESWAYARDVAWGNGFQLVAAEPDADVDSGAEDPRWRRIPGRDALPGPGPLMSASDLRLVKCACAYYGHGGFVVCGDQAQFRAGRREDLEDESNQVDAPGCTLYVALRDDDGAWEDHQRGPQLPLPLDVCDGEELLVTSLFDEDSGGSGREDQGPRSRGIELQARDV